MSPSFLYTCSSKTHHSHAYHNTEIVLVLLLAAFLGDLVGPKSADLIFNFIPDFCVGN